MLRLQQCVTLALQTLVLQAALAAPLQAAHTSDFVLPDTATKTTRNLNRIVTIEPVPIDGVLAGKFMSAATLASALMAVLVAMAAVTVSANIPLKRRAFLYGNRAL